MPEITGRRYNENGGVAGQKKPPDGYRDFVLGFFATFFAKKKSKKIQENGANVCG